jgi:hypothetical protein
MADRTVIEMRGGVVGNGRLGRRKLFMTGDLRNQIGAQASAVRSDQGRRMFAGKVAGNDDVLAAVTLQVKVSASAMKRRCAITPRRKLK